MGVLMHAFFFAFFAGMFCVQAAAQGLLPRWEVEAMARELQQHSQEVQQLLQQVRAKEWIQDGASEAYVQQQEALQSDLAHLARSAQLLEEYPEKLSTVVDTFLWIDRLGSMLDSLTEGVERYQNPAVAALLRSAGTRSSRAEEKLKEYMRQLAVEREAEMEIAHNEAQRCRESLAKQPRSRD